MKRKLIEVALPLEAINRESAREKSIRHGHPSTLHLWWARRPLAACRAVLFAQLVDDPSSHPEQFPTEADQAIERQRLFDIIERLVVWENTTDEALLAEAHAEILKSTGGNPPAILDPFAGGGSIPLEAQRLGLEAHASNLNPVAVLINKALIEIPPKWAGQPPVLPGAAGNGPIGGGGANPTGTSGGNGGFGATGGSSYADPSSTAVSVQNAVQAGPGEIVFATGAPAITSADNTSGDEETLMTPFTVTTTGVPLAGISEAGPLPGGVTFVDNLNGTATISGTPANGTAGAYLITITAANGILPDATQNFTLTVATAPPPNPNPMPSGTQPQTPTDNCDAAPSGDRLSGNEQLMKAPCMTPAGQLVGVIVNPPGKAATRGDVVTRRAYLLRCVKNGKTSKPKHKSYGQYCTKKQGPLVIRILRHGHKLRITWSAPATPTYAAYTKTRTYRT